MSDLRTATTQAAATRTTWRRAAFRWLVSFAGFPLGGVAAMVLTGPVDSLLAALVGGLATGTVLGAVQAWAMGPARPRPALWVGATAAGLMAGLGIGASVVDYRTSLGALVVQGAVCGALVGAVQAAVLLPRIGRLALAWPLALGAIWATGWAVTASIGVQVDEQFTVFGSSGAVVVTLLTAALPVLLNRHHLTEKSAS